MVRCVPITGKAGSWAAFLWDARCVVEQADEKHSSLVDARQKTTVFELPMYTRTRRNQLGSPIGSYQKPMRAVAISPDGGQTWKDFRDDAELLEPVCQGSIVRYSLDREGGKNRLLFANPAQSKRGNRTNMTVKLSYDEGQTWPVAKQIHAGPSAYCCLTVLNDGRIGLLYEGGKFGRYDSILFARFNLTWLTVGKDSLEQKRD